METNYQTVFLLWHNDLQSDRNQQFLRDADDFEWHQLWHNILWSLYYRALWPSQISHGWGESPNAAMIGFISPLSVQELTIKQAAWMSMMFFIFANVGHFSLDKSHPQSTEKSGTAMIVIASFFIFGKLIPLCESSRKF